MSGGNLRPVESFNGSPVVVTERSTTRPPRKLRPVSAVVGNTENAASINNSNRDSYVSEKSYPDLIFEIENSHKEDVQIDEKEKWYINEFPGLFNPYDYDRRLKENRLFDFESFRGKTVSYFSSEKPCSYWAFTDGTWAAYIETGGIGRDWNLNFNKEKAIEIGLITQVELLELQYILNESYIREEEEIRLINELSDSRIYVKERIKRVFGGDI